MDLDRDYEDRYVKLNNSHFIGWYDAQHLLPIYKLLSDSQKSSNLGEIGLYRGASVIPLLLCARKGEKVIGVDFYSHTPKDAENSKNILSGSSEKSTLYAHLQHVFSDDYIDRFVLLDRDSQQMIPADLCEPINGGNYRLFSVDGLHTVEATYVDLGNAYHVLSEDGVIIVDDYMHSTSYPGVRAGVDKFMRKFTSALRLVFVGYNKAMFCRPEYFEKYYTMIRDFTDNNAIYRKSDSWCRHDLFVDAKQFSAACYRDGTW